MSEHRWTVVVIGKLDEQRAADLAAVPMLERLDRLPEFFAAADIVRGPLCSECRVSWEDVHSFETPWPCPGQRPRDLGGPLPLDATHKSRQQRRAEQRSAVKIADRGAEQNVLGSVNAAIERLRTERSV